MSANTSRKWDRLYLGALSLCRIKIPREKPIICAYTINIDKIITINGKQIQNLCKGYERQVIEQLRKPKGYISSPLDFLVGILHYMGKGEGGEWAIHNKQAAEWINSNFEGNYEIGGTGAQAAKALANLGVKAILHVTNLSRMQAEVLTNSRNILIPAKQGFKTPFETIRKEDFPVLHYIGEFRKGTTVKIADKKFIAMSDDRFITSYDPVNAKLNIDPNFSTMTLRHIKNIKKAIISGYNSLRDGNMFKEKIDKSVDQVKNWKKINPNLLIHLEEADLQSSIIRRYVAKRVYPFADSIGMNSHELQAVARSLGLEIDISSEKELYKGAKFIFDTFQPKRINVHSKSFSLTITRNNPIRESYAQAFGCLVSANRALTGKFGDLKNLEKINKTLSLSQEGLRIVDKIEKILLKSSKPGFNISLCVAKEVKNPIHTVGLGDLYTAGVVSLL